MDKDKRILELEMKLAMEESRLDMMHHSQLRHIACTETFKKKLDELDLKYKMVIGETVLYESQITELKAKLNEIRLKREMMWRSGYGEAVRRHTANEDLDERNAWESTVFAKEK